MDHEAISDDEISALEHRLAGILPDARRIVVSLSSETDLSEDRTHVLAHHLLDLGDLAIRLLASWDCGPRNTLDSRHRCQEVSAAVPGAGSAAALGDAVSHRPGAAKAPPSGRLLRWTGARFVEAGPADGEGKS